MKKSKLVVGVICLLCLVSVVTATPYVGDEVTFGVEVGQESEEGYCDAPPSVECQGIPFYACEPDAGCTWYPECDLTCDLDDSDGTATYSYAGYALKDPTGTVVEQQTLEFCDATYQPSINYIVDKPGTWKFCAIRYAYVVDYVDICAVTPLDCTIEECQEIIVDDCDPEELQSSLASQAASYFLSWIGMW